MSAKNVVKSSDQVLTWGNTCLCIRARRWASSSSVPWMGVTEPTRTSSAWNTISSKVTQMCTKTCNYRQSNVKTMSSRFQNLASMIATTSIPAVNMSIVPRSIQNFYQLFQNSKTSWITTPFLRYPVHSSLIFLWLASILCIRFQLYNQWHFSQHQCLEFSSR